MKRSSVVELWDRKRGVVGLYQVVVTRRFWAVMVGGPPSWVEVKTVEGEDSQASRDTVKMMVEHDLSLTPVNGWFLVPL